jgi:hypothetical protein
VCEFGNSRVQVLRRRAIISVEILGGPGDAPDRMNNPWGLCLDAHGEPLRRRFALNHRVLQVRATARFERRIWAKAAGSRLT